MPEPYTELDAPPLCTSPSTADTGSTATSCPQIDWLLFGSGPESQWIEEVLTLPDGDILVIGGDELGFTLAAGRPDEAVVPVDCSIFPSNWFARVTVDGAVAWAHRLTSTCDGAYVDGALVTPVGQVLVWGTYGDAPLTIAEASTNPLSLPTSPSSSVNGYWALLEADGTPVVARAMEDGTVNDLRVNIADVAPDGTIYLAGSLREPTTFNVGESDAVTLEVPAGAVNGDPDVSWVGAWEPDGSLRWAKLEGVVYGGADGVFSDGAPMAWTPQVAIMTAADDGVTIISNPDGETVVDACGPFETPTTGTPDVKVTYQAATGAVAGPPELYRAMNRSLSQRTNHGTLAVGYARTLVEPVGINGVGYEDDAGGLYFTDERGHPASSIARTSPTFVPHPPFIRALGATNELVVALAQGSDQAGVEHGWTCGPVIEGLRQDVPSVPTTGLSAVVWGTFDHDLTPQCGGLLGIANFGHGVDMTVDHQDGLIMATSFHDRWLFDEGGPNEVELTSDGTDVLLVRLAVP